MAINSKSGDKNVAISESNKQSILEYLRENPDAKSIDIASVLGLGISRTKVYLAELVASGSIISIGVNKNIQVSQVIKKLI